MFTLRKHQATATTTCPPSSSSITSINDLDDDILVEILCRLPTIRYMAKYKRVSKLWCALISLVCIPRKKPSSTVYGLLFNTCPNPPDGKKGPWNFAFTHNLVTLAPTTSIKNACLGSSLPFHPSPDAFLDCNNGMLLFFHRPTMHYFVCNPATKQYTPIPNSPPNNRVPATAALIFDPHYKIVHISRKPSCTITMNIFSPVTREWAVYSNLNLENYIARSVWSPRSVFFNGSVYRLSVSGHLLKFDVRQIGCRAIELPKLVVKAIPIGCLGVSQNNLQYAWSDHVSQVTVWTFLETGRTDDWVLKHTICLHYFYQHPLCRDLHCRSQFSIYAFHPSSDMVFIGNLAGIFSYDPDMKRLECICELTTDKSIYSGQYLVFPFSVNPAPLDAFSLSIIKESAGRCLRKLHF